MSKEFSSVASLWPVFISSVKATSLAKRISPLGILFACGKQGKEEWRKETRGGKLEESGTKRES